jgi:glycosyltransferase involved in cell wall biosynthesis
MVCRREYRVQNEMGLKRRVPLVSICCTTYNHAKFIAQAIEGFLIQKTTFPIEIIIHDDASTDGTAGIVRNYVEKYPDLIIPIFQTKNQYSQGIKPVFRFVFPRARGKYIANCEGDDYWTDPLKLQKQVEFLERSPDFILTFTNTKVIDEKGRVTSESMVKRKRDTFEHRDMPIHAPNLTRVFRNENLSALSNLMNDVPGGDTYLITWLSRFGKIRYMDFISGVYRIHSGGVWSGKTHFEKIEHFFDTRYALLKIIDDKILLRRFVESLFRLLVQMDTDAKNPEEQKSFFERCKQLDNFFQNHWQNKGGNIYRLVLTQISKRYPLALKNLILKLFFKSLNFCKFNM